MSFIINQLILALFNWLNSQIDAYKILQNKTVAHAVNFGMYAGLTGTLVYLWRHDLWLSVLFCTSAFFNRQLSFDIPLNLERKLPWYYQSTANPPKALMDKIERLIFPSNDGKLIAAIYAACWVASIIIYFL